MHHLLSTEAGRLHGEEGPGVDRACGFFAGEDKLPLHAQGIQRDGVREGERGQLLEIDAGVPKENKVIKDINVVFIVAH